MEVRTDGGETTAGFINVAPPFVREWTEDNLTTTGGARFAIYDGANLSWIRKVMFGGTEATIVEQSDSMITIVTPPHAPGRVAIKYIGDYYTYEIEQDVYPQPTIHTLIRP